tara:strand:+ start:166 stop:477 length:312 start_codon:yes stop_codon:yes gene_type:complete
VELVAVGEINCFHCKCPNLNLIHDCTDIDSPDIDEMSVLHCPWCGSLYEVMKPILHSVSHSEIYEQFPNYWEEKRTDGLEHTPLITTKRKFLRKSVTFGGNHD